MCLCESQPPEHSKAAAAAAEARPGRNSIRVFTLKKVTRTTHARAQDAEVTEFNADLKKTLKEMFLVMYASKGVGLAAPQVSPLGSPLSGVGSRVWVLGSKVSGVEPRM